MMLAAAAACKSAVQSGNMNSAASALKGAGTDDLQVARGLRSNGAG